MRILSCQLTLSLLATALAPAALAADLFVDAGLTTGANDGSSWADAFQGSDGLVAALAAATAGDRVLVAEGTYRPSSTGDRNASFELRNDVAIFGGFAGGETSPDERPAFGLAPSVLSGDLAGDDPTSLSDNSYHVVTNFPGVQPTTLLDGFVISGGYAEFGSGTPGFGAGFLCLVNGRPTLRNCRFEGNISTATGGAVYVSGNLSAPRFIACSFVGNIAGGSGGGFASQMAGPVHLDRCHFEGNQANNGGGLSSIFPAGLLITNSTFVDNLATGTSGGGAIAFLANAAGARVRGCTIVGNRALVTGGGGISNSSTTTAPAIANCIVWGNRGPGSSQGLAAQIQNLAMGSFTYSIVEGIFGGIGNLDVDPGFVDLAGGDLRLTLASPAIDAGDSDAVVPAAAGGVPVDFDGFRRRHDVPSVPDTGAGPAPAVDIGAFEYTTLIGRPFCEAISNSTGAQGRIDATGSTSVAANSVTLTATSLPPGSNGFFLTSRVTGLAVVGSGNLCLGGSIGRYTGAGQILNSGAAGEFVLALDLTQHPTPTGLVSVMPGETWRFQAWFRDVVLGFPTSNFTDAVAVTFE